MTVLPGWQLYLLMSLCACDPSNLVVVTLKDGTTVYRYPDAERDTFMDWYLASSREIATTRLGEETHLRKAAEFRLPATATLEELLVAQQRSNGRFLTGSS